MKKNFQNIVMTMFTLGLSLLVNTVAEATPTKIVKDSPGGQRRVTPREFPGQNNDTSMPVESFGGEEIVSYTGSSAAFEEDTQQPEGTNFEDAYDYRAVFLGPILQACGQDTSCRILLFHNMVQNIRNSGYETNTRMVEVWGSCFQHTNSVARANCMADNLPQFMPPYVIQHKTFISEASKVCAQIDDDYNEVACYKVIEQKTAVKQSRLYLTPGICNDEIGCHIRELEAVIGRQY